MFPTTVIGKDESWHCDDCGGYLTDNWAVNAVSEGKTLGVYPSRLVGGITYGGTNNCPKDDTHLTAPPSEMVPAGLTIGVCSKCHAWWFPGNELFTFATASKAKNDYVHLWKKSELNTYVYPAFAVLIISGLLAGGVYFVQRQQRVMVSAQNPVSDLSFIYVGDNAVDVRFVSKLAPGIIEVWKGDARLSLVSPQIEDGFYVARISNLSRGSYKLKIFGQEYPFSVN